MARSITSLARSSQRRFCRFDNGDVKGNHPRLNPAGDAPSLRANAGQSWRIPRRTASRRVPHFTAQGSEQCARLLQVARQTAVVKNRLLMPEQAAYCMAWHEQMFLNERPETVLYKGMGADVSTVLLSTNAHKILGVDLRQLEIGLLREGFTHWDELESKIWGNVSRYNILTCDRPFDYAGMPSIKSPEWRNYLERYLQHGIRCRYEDGFWNAGILDTFGRERLLLLELKRLGVDPNTIKFSGTTIAFSWAYPGGLAEERVINYTSGKNSDMPSSVDVFYQKSLNNHCGIADKSTFHQSLLRRGGHALMGLANGSWQIPKLQNFPWPWSYEPIEIDPRLTLLMTLKVARNNAGLRNSDADLAYGWMLFGAKKLPKP